MKFKQKISGSVNPFALVIIGFCLGLTVMYLYLQPRLTYQGKSLMDWVITVNNSENENKQLVAKVEKLSVSPTPTLLTNISKKSGLKTAKGMNCIPTSNGGSNCTEYEYTYDPNAPAKTCDLSGHCYNMTAGETLPASLFQGPALIPLGGQ